jgi:hypothetical protein
MKLSNCLSILIALTTATVASANESKPVFTLHQYEFLGGNPQITISLMNDGTAHATVIKTDSNNQRTMKYDKTFATLSQSDQVVVEAALPLVQPGMKIRELTKEEEELNQGCASEGAASYTVDGDQFPNGSITVSVWEGCVQVGLEAKTPAGAKAVQGVNSMISIMKALLSTYGNEIYGSVNK